MKERKWGDRFPNVGNGGRFRVVEGKWEERGDRKKKKRKIIIIIMANNLLIVKNKIIYKIKIKQNNK